MGLMIGYLNEAGKSPAEIKLVIVEMLYLASIKVIKFFKQFYLNIKIKKELK